MQKLFKGFIICLIFISLCFFNNAVKAADAYFVWEKTVIDVPVFSSLEEYKDNYKLKLYVNGIQSNDYYVEYETNCSTFSTVLTNKIGKYTVYYKAYSKNNYLSSEQAIIFNVVDVTAPTIDLSSDTIDIEVGTTINKEWFSVNDDTCSKDEINISINDTNVIYNVIGKYSATITATDLYNNSKTVSFTVRVVDKTKPIIKVLKPLIFDYLEEVDVKSYFVCLDNYDNDITDLLVIKNLDTKTLGKKEITLEVSDYSNNKTTLTLEVMVVDKVMPILNLITEEITLDIIDFKNYDEKYFGKYILNISDNYSKKEDINVIINVDTLEEVVSDYYINFIAIDENNNKTKKQILVKLREFIGPELICDDVINICVGEEIDLYSLVRVVDKYDLDAASRLTIDDGGFDNLALGTYKIKYTCFNTSGEYSEKIVTINVFGLMKEENGSSIKTLHILIISAVVVVVSVSTTAVVLILRKRKNRY